MPGCTLTFEVLQRNAGYRNSFGWYNVTGAPPALGDHHEVLSCTDVVCPFGQVCRVGACLDPCATLSSDNPQICVNGVCVDRCECTGCEPGETCHTDGTCVPTPCVDRNCAPGEYCSPDGSCVDRCLGAACQGVHNSPRVER